MLFIVNANGKRKIDSTEIPLAFSVTKNGSVIYGEQAEHAPIIWLRTHEERIYIQPESSAYSVSHNEILIDGSAWLAPGDRVGMGESLISISEDQGWLVFEIDGTDTKQSPPPPELPGEPPPEIIGEAEIVSDDTQEAAPSSSAHLVKSKRHIGLRRKILFVIFAFLLLGVGFVLTAAPVRINIQPGTASISFTGALPPIPIAERYLVFPGTYVVEANAPGYHNFEKGVSVKFGANYDLRFQMRKLPGLLNVAVRPDTPAKVSVDGNVRGPSPLRAYSIEPGSHKIHVSAERYFPTSRVIDVRGMGETQNVRFELKPAWGTLIVSSEPDDATVSLNGQAIGQTPFAHEPLQGKYQIVLEKDGWKSAFSTIEIKAGTTVRLPTFQLRRVDGQLQVSSHPAGALVTIDDQFRGRTPVTIPLPSGKNYKVKLSKPGFADHTQEVAIKGKIAPNIYAKLTPEYGIIFFRTRPSGAKLQIDGKEMGSATRRLRLTTAPHRVTVSKRGYAPYSTTVTPRKGLSKRINIQLKRHIEIAREMARTEIKTKSGQVMRFIPIDKPMQFKVGASRREAGRRSNEAQYTVELTRSFMIGAKEVTNSEFQQFRAQHNSGSEQGYDLTDPQQPVVSVSWDDAARYANWLSKKEKVSPVYREENGKMVANQPIANGYRLPTEAEWVFIARYDGGRESLAKPKKFIWGQSMPPTAKSGNFADDTASGRISFSIRGYRDGYEVSAPVGNFSPNKSGIYDLAGNVSEWCHDHYDTAVGMSQRLKRDPTGPKTGSFHVVRGSSWRHGRITELRLSFRDYAKSPRNDLGFRIARYVDIPN